MHKLVTTSVSANDDGDNNNNNNNNNNTKMGHHSSTPPETTTTTAPTTIVGRPSTWVTLVLQLPILVWFCCFATMGTIQYAYHSYVVPTIQSYKRSELVDGGLYDEFRTEFTYYNRHCSAQDISTHNANDLLIAPEMSQEQAATVMLKHGAVAVPHVLTKETATALRDYLANKHSSHLKYNEVFWEEMGRLALGLGTHDHHPAIIAAALREVGSNANLQKTLEGILGPNPALSEISTLTSMYDNDDQYLHSDSDYFGSSLLYSQSFLHSYSLFIALQDTTQALGATTICPGTHYCADEELAELCYEHGAFSISTNGKTGPDQGMMHQGDALLFNQNIFHGGPSNQDDSKQDRIMFILSFVSSKTSNQDLRRQGLGTYYYQRWNMWGHTFDDLKNAATVMVQPWGALRALGLLPTKGLTWVHHFCHQLANKDDFYEDVELEDFKIKILDHYKVPHFLRSPSTEWERFIPETLQLWLWALGMVYAVALCLYICTTAVVNVALHPQVRAKSPLSIRSLCVKHLVLGVLFLALKRHIDHTDIAKAVQTGRVHQRPFANDTVTPVDDNQSTTTTTTTKTRITTLPERNDVLFSARLQNVDYLASYTRFLDFHPGNQKWLSAIQKKAAENQNGSSNNNNNNNAAETIVTELLQTREAGIATRFLRQNVATGYWEIMTHAEAILETQKALGLDPTTRILEGENDDSAFSGDELLTCSQRNLSKTESYEIGDKIWAWNEPFQTFTEAILTEMDGSDEDGGIFTFEYFIPDEEGRLTGQGSPEDDSVRPYVALQSGDRVSVDYHGSGEAFFVGTVINVHPDGTCSLQFDDGEYVSRAPRQYLMPLYEDVVYESADVENIKSNQQDKEDEEEGSNSSGDGDDVVDEEEGNHYDEQHKEKEGEAIGEEQRHVAEE